MLAKFLVVVPLLLWPLAAPAARATEAPEDAAPAAQCREPRKSFAEGVRHFERREWIPAVVKMRDALAAGCAEEVRVVVPYGRWVYPYTPGVYLGVALSKAASCPEDQACLKPVDWWKKLGDEEARALVECAACSPDRGPKGECKLGLDWWHDLAESGQTVAEVRDYGGDCGGLSDVFTRVFSKRDPNVRTCTALVAELNQTLDSCRQVQAWAKPAP